MPSLSGPPTALSDLDLIARAAGGDQQVVATLFDRYGNVLYAVAYRLVGQRADAEEVVLEAFAQAWRDAGRFEGSRDGGPALEPRLRAFSRINDWVGEKIFLSRNRLAPEHPISARTAPENFPAYSIRFNSTGSFPTLERPDAWALEVGGRVRKPIRLTRPMIEALPRLTYTVKHHCVEGWTAIGTWSGVPISTIAAMVEPTADARYIRFDSSDSGYYNGWDLKSAMHPQTILAYAWNDRPLKMNHGAPLRLYSPIKLGYKLTKYLTAMTFTNKRPGGYWEDQGYPWFAGL